MRRIAKPAYLLLGLVAAHAVASPPVNDIAIQLISVHMAQHLILIAVAAPLIALGWPERLPLRMKLIHAWCLFVGVFLFWHWPAAFQWAAGDPLTEGFELLTLGLAASAFWLSTIGSHATTNKGAAALAVMTAAVATDLPGVIMVFSPKAFSIMPSENAAAFGLTALADQQIAGLLMWVPTNIVFFGIATWMFALWMTKETTIVGSPHHET